MTCKPINTKLKQCTTDVNKFTKKRYLKQILPPRHQTHLIKCAAESVNNDTVHCPPKREDIKPWTVTLSILSQFSKFFHSQTQQEK